jgi:hypothetical protein
MQIKIHKIEVNWVDDAYQFVYRYSLLHIFNKTRLKNIAEKINMILIQYNRVIDELYY